MNLSGTGNGNQVSVLPTSLSFGSFRVGTQSPAQMVTVTNNQSVAITLSAALGGNNSGDFAIGAGTTCGASLTATSNCVYAVTFKPLARKCARHPERLRQPGFGESACCRTEWHRSVGD